MSARFALTAWCTAAALTLLLAFTALAASDLRRPDEPAVAPGSATTADPVAEGRMKDYLHQAMVLRDEFDARDPGWSRSVRQKGLILAEQIGSVNPEKLRPARKIIQREYKGWVLLMVARTFGVEDTELDVEQQRIRYATLAVAEFDAALNLMGDVDTRVAEGRGGEGPEALYKWMTRAPSIDYQRTKYLKAVGLAIIARAGGNSTKAEVLKLLASISKVYMRDNPPENNPDLKWAYLVPLTINALREGTLAPEPATTLSLWNAQDSIVERVVPFPGGKALLQLPSGKYFLSAVDGGQRWPIEVQEPGTTIAVLVSAFGEPKEISPQPAADDPGAGSMTPLVWIGLGFSAALVIFLMVTFFVTLKEAPISQAAYNSLHFLTALCAGFAGGFLAGEVLVHWEQQLVGGAKLLLSGTAGFALFFLVWFRYPARSTTRTRRAGPGRERGGHAT